MLIGSRLTLRRTAFAAATLLALTVAALVSAGPAGAAKTDNCAKEVFADWYDNGRVDNIYPQHCYREAIKLLPVDIRDYSSAREDILRALAYAKQGKSDPGDNGSSSNGNNSGGGGTPSGGNTSGGGGIPTTDPGGEGPSSGGSTSVDTSGPSAVPVPLIVLAAIAALLLALGAAGYVTRRRRGSAAA